MGEGWPRAIWGPEDALAETLQLVNRPVPYTSMGGWLALRHLDAIVVQTEDHHLVVR